MRTIKLALIAGALASMTAAGFAQSTETAGGADAVAAQSGDQIRNKRMDRLDADKDGTISKEEFLADQRLKDADTNGDGVLSPDELAAMIQKREIERKVERLTRRLDVNGDGKVTIAEIENQKAKRFALLDRNDDGKLEASELRRMKHHWGHHKFGRHGHHGGKGHHGHHGKHRTEEPSKI